MRLYSTEAGLFTSGDPLWAAQLAHSAYHYAYNNPLTFSDPSGLMASKNLYGKGMFYLTAATAQALEMADYWENHPHASMSEQEFTMVLFFGEGGGGGGSGSTNRSINVTLRETEDDPGIEFDIHPQVLEAIQAGFKIYPPTYGGGIEPTDFLFDIMPSNVLRKWGLTALFAGATKAISSKVAAKAGANLFGKEVANTATRMGRDGRAVEVLFKDGSKIDINAARVKEWIPNLHPHAPTGTLQKVKFDNFLPGSKGYKRTPTQDEINFLNSLSK